jgi:hypothetical protein
LKLTWELVGGDYDGRKVWQNINYLNNNPKAQEIGQKELARILLAFGLPGLSDTEELHFRDAMITIKIKQDPGYEARNEVTRVGPVDHQQPAQAPRQTTTRSVPPAVAQAPRAASGGAPWRK